MYKRVKFYFISVNISHNLMGHGICFDLKLMEQGVHGKSHQSTDAEVISPAWVSQCGQFIIHCTMIPP